MRGKENWGAGLLDGAWGDVGGQGFSLARDKILPAFSDLSTTPLRIMAKAMKKAAAAPAPKKAMRRAMKAMK